MSGVAANFAKLFVLDCKNLLIDSFANTKREARGARYLVRHADGDTVQKW
jgi:hypothetical protein